MEPPLNGEGPPAADRGANSRNYESTLEKVKDTPAMSCRTRELIAPRWRNPPEVRRRPLPPAPRWCDLNADARNRWAILILANGCRAGPAPIEEWDRRVAVLWRRGYRP